MYCFFVEQIKWNDLRLIIKYDEMFICALLSYFVNGLLFDCFFLSQ